MSLKIVHIVFVTCVSLLAFLMGGWCLAQDGSGYVAGAVASFLFGGGAIAYGFWFWRKIRTPEEERRKRRKLLRMVTGLLPLCLLVAPRTAQACEVCYGGAEGPMIDAARIGVFLLWGTVVAIQVGLAGFFIYLGRRSKKYHGEIAPWWVESIETKES